MSSSFFCGLFTSSAWPAPIFSFSHFIINWAAPVWLQRFSPFVYLISVSKGWRKLPSVSGELLLSRGLWVFYRVWGCQLNETVLWIVFGIFRPAAVNTWSPTLINHASIKTKIPFFCVSHSSLLLIPYLDVFYPWPGNILPAYSTLLHKLFFMSGYQGQDHEQITIRL